MKKSFPAALALMLLLSTGCSIFHHKDKQARQPEVPPAVGTEAEFRDRWIAKRARDLVATGAAKTDGDAQAMASVEFAKEFPYLNAGNSSARH